MMTIMQEALTHLRALSSHESQSKGHKEVIQMKNLIKITDAQGTTTYTDKGEAQAYISSQAPVYVARKIYNKKVNGVRYTNYEMVYNNTHAFKMEQERIAEEQRVLAQETLSILRSDIEAGKLTVREMLEIATEYKIKMRNGKKDKVIADLLSALPSTVGEEE